MYVTVDPGVESIHTLCAQGSVVLIVFVSMGRTLGAFFANMLGMGEAPRTLSEDDFVK